MTKNIKVSIKKIMKSDDLKSDDPRNYKSVDQKKIIKSDNQKNVFYSQKKFLAK